jgi:hypothetical protein
LEDFRLACWAGGADDDYFIIQYLPIRVREYVRAWLEFLMPNSIHSWAELKHVFVGNFQGMYVCPGNSWDLKSCKQELGESLRDYIRRFSKHCNSLPDIIDADIISAFLSGTTCKSLVYKLGCRKPRTTRELLDIATNHASGKEAVGAVFIDGRAKGQAKREDQDEGPSSGQGKRKKKDWRRANPNTAVAANHAGKRQGNASHFEQLLEKQCTNHDYPIKHKLKDCKLLKRMLG